MFSLGGYPGVIEGDKRISGELWEIDDAAFARCDRLEGHPNFYKRWQVGIVSDSEDDKEVTAWIYIYQGDVSGLKPIDNWRSEEHTSELQSLMRISYAVYCLKKKNATQLKN